MEEKNKVPMLLEFLFGEAAETALAKNTGQAQRGGHTAIDGNRLLAKFNRIKSILDGLIHRHIASHYGDCFNLDSRVTHGHNQPYSIIGSGVGINDEVTIHYFPLPKN